METPYDWITVGIFAGLIVLFMQRSTSDTTDDVDDPLWMYLAAGAGCAVANYIGNEGQHVLAIIAIVATLAFVFHFLKPFRWPRAD
ncbi:XrtV sorting system accessory protein [Sphingomonas sp. LHG3443-2]|uniref:XrtV sorting system accessory protein n=1 Tax=Sphingomonas sp. LHG3443-2 TaxID=2804639 RepID=UPI003CF3CCD9